MYKRQGRNVERAEDTCRILDVHLQLLVEDPSVDTQLSAATLYAVLGICLLYTLDVYKRQLPRSASK